MREGYGGGAKDGSQPAYHGYHYRLFTAQGKDAPGGAYDYIVNGKLFGGFAVVAWPASYGNSGVQTFIVNHDGVVYEKDLGPGSAAEAAKMKRLRSGQGLDQGSLKRLAHVFGGPMPPRDARAPSARASAACTLRRRTTQERAGR